MLKHGMTGTTEHRIWSNFRNRCNNPNNDAYHNYGGRGIKVDPIWDDSFVEFFKYMGKRPSKKHSIERIDNDKNYGPGNCKWATKKEQANNCRSNTFVTYKGDTKTVSQWADIAGIDKNLLYARFKMGWSIEDTFEKPVRQLNRDITVNGESLTYKGWAEKTGITLHLIHSRLHKGWSIERAVTEELNHAQSKTFSHT